jgi:hypothetical protein
MLFIICDRHNFSKKYKRGLNISYDKPYCAYKKNHLPNFYGSGMDYIALVIIPDTDKCDTTENKIYVKLPKMYVGELYYLYDIKTAYKFKLKITNTYINEFFESRHNTIKNFDFALRKGLINDCINDCVEELMDIASSRGRIDVLEWCLKSNLPLKYSEKALNMASENGHVKVLDWWVKSNLPLKYTENAISGAYHNWCYESLKWWSNSDLPMKYTKEELKKFVIKCKAKYYKDFVDCECD